MLEFFEVFRYRNLADNRYEGFVRGWNLLENAPGQVGGKTHFLDALFLWNSAHCLHFMAFQYSALGGLSHFDAALAERYAYQGEALFPDMEYGEEEYLRFFGGNPDVEKRVAFLGYRSTENIAPGSSPQPYVEIVYYDKPNAQMYIHFHHLDAPENRLVHSVFNLGYLRAEGLALVTTRQNPLGHHEIWGAEKHEEWFGVVAELIGDKTLQRHAASQKKFDGVLSRRMQRLIQLVRLVKTLPEESLLLVDDVDEFADSSPYWEAVLKTLASAVKEKRLQVFLTARRESGLQKRAQSEKIPWGRWQIVLREALG